jgi:hypothetical protein
MPRGTAAPTFPPQAFIVLVIARRASSGCRSSPGGRLRNPGQATQARRVFRSAWDVIIEGKADINGVLALNFEPQGGEAKLVRVNVVAKTKAKQIAKDLANQLTFTAGANYKVKANDNKVTVSLKNKKAPVYSLGIAEQALDGVSIRLTKG